MGALHEGHLSLIRRARRENERAVVSIFVNPLQFGPREDYRRYPRPFAADAQLCRRAGVDALYHPTLAAMYPRGFSTQTEVMGPSQDLEGKWRPGHFTGVATVVLKLFHAVQPDRAYFGEKDFQQLQVVRRMVRDLDLPLRIVGCATVREPDGLALSSRNVYLSSEERVLARLLPAGLREAVDAFHDGESDPRRAREKALRVIRKIPGVQVDYVDIRDSQTLQPVSKLAPGQRILAAIRIGSTRLIDNMEL